jgi:hypothetical protein
MNFRIQKKDVYVLIEEQKDGLAIRELLPSFDSNEDGSYVFFIKSENYLQEEIEDLVPKNSNFKGLVVFVEVKKEFLPENNQIISLPTLHEAEEAIFLNNLENEFLKELEE